MTNTRRSSPGMSPLERIWWLVATVTIVAVFLFVSIWGGAKVDRYNAEHQETHQEATP